MDEDKTINSGQQVSADDNSQVIPQSDETNQDTQTNEQPIENIEGNDIQSEEQIDPDLQALKDGTRKWKQGDPFNLHPDWINRDKKLDQALQLNQQLSDQLKQFTESKEKSSSSNDQDKSPSVEDLSDDEFVPFLEQLPKRTFKENKFDDEGNMIEGYQSMEELYNDFRAALLKDQLLVSSLRTQKEETVQKQQNEFIEAENAKVIQVLDNNKDVIKAFTNWLDPILEGKSESDKWIADMGFVQQAHYFKQHKLAEVQAKIANANKDAARKVGGVGSAVGNNQQQGVNIPELRKKSIADMYATN